MNAEFNWWLLIVGLVLGAALTWLVMAESTRRDADVTESEQRGEALWIAAMMSSAGRSTDSAQVEDILRLHQEYLAAPPPDEPAEVEVEPSVPPGADVAAVSTDAATTETPASSELSETSKVPEAPDVLEAASPASAEASEERP